MHKLLFFKVIVSVTSPKNQIHSVLMLDRFLLLKSFFFFKTDLSFSHLEFEELSKCHLFIIVGCVTNSTNKSTKKM